MASFASIDWGNRIATLELALAMTRGREQNVDDQSPESAFEAALLVDGVQE